jgi:hypothetical protein
MTFEDGRRATMQFNRERYALVWEVSSGQEFRPPERDKNLDHLMSRGGSRISAWSPGRLSSC